jgi:hypothetical protein
MGPNQVPAFKDVCDWSYPNPEIESLNRDGPEMGHFRLKGRVLNIHLLV